MSKLSDRLTVVKQNVKRCMATLTGTMLCQVKSLAIMCLIQSDCESV